MTDLLLRPFVVADTDACYDVCLRTTDNGGDGRHLYTDPRIVGEVYVGPYLVRHPECAFVLEDEEGVGGYIVGTPDTASYDEWAEAEWFPLLRQRYPQSTFPAGTPDANYVNLIHAPPRMPAEIVERHPAHLHIDLLPRFQRRGLGRRLMDALFEQCRAAGAPAIHLGCSPENANAIAFYRHLGFEDLMAGFLWGRSTDPL